MTLVYVGYGLAAVIMIAATTWILSGHNRR